MKKSGSFTTKQAGQHRHPALMQIISAHQPWYDDSTNIVSGVTSLSGGLSLLLAAQTIDKLLHAFGVNALTAESALQLLVAVSMP